MTVTEPSSSSSLRPEVDDLLQLLEAVHVEVVEVEPPGVAADERERRAGDLLVDAEAAPETLAERRLAGTEVAGEEQQVERAGPALPGRQRDLRSPRRTTWSPRPGANRRASDHSTPNAGGDREERAAPIHPTDSAGPAMWQEPPGHLPLASPPPDRARSRCGVDTMRRTRHSLPTPRCPASRWPSSCSPPVWRRGRPTPEHRRRR